MNWSDEGIVLSAKKHGEHALIITLLTRENGRHIGLVRGGASHKQRGIFQTGNLVSAQWKGRLSEHLGTYICELKYSYVAQLMDHPMHLLALTSATALLEMFLPEREPCYEVFESFSELIKILEKDHSWREKYVLWEKDLLSYLGYGLDLSKCAVTGSTENLFYISPRTGRAVSRAAGEPYLKKLFLLPSFFILNNQDIRREDIVNGLSITGHFLSACARDSDVGNLPFSRGYFLERLNRTSG